MFFTKLMSLRRPTVIATTASIAFTTLLGVSIILLDLETQLWFKVLISSAVISIACTGVLACMSALTLPRVRLISIFGITCSFIALLLSLVMTWAPTYPHMSDPTETATLWAYIGAQVSLLFSVGKHDRPGWNRWLTLSAALSVLTAALYTPVIWGWDWFSNELMSRCRISLVCLAAAGGIILPALARLMPPAAATTPRPRTINPTVVLSTAQATSLRQQADAEGVTEQELLNRLLPPTQTKASTPAH